jgi:segregation and condensation protein A
VPEGDPEGEEQYHVRLPVFDGPLDLLLHLIRVNELDIYDIPIAEITRQYLLTLELMRELNLSVAGDFILMAATLIHIKSKMLLPPPHEDGTTEEPSEDPRAALVARLLEYQRYKDAAHLLHERETLRSAMWLRPDAALGAILPQNGAAEGELEVDLFELVTAFRAVLDRARLRRDLTFEREVISIEEMIDLLEARVPSEGSILFEELFSGMTTRALLIVTFLALLEIVRLRRVRVYQPQAFGAIHVIRAPQNG